MPPKDRNFEHPRSRGRGGGGNHNNQNNNQNNKKPPICRRCGEVGHTAMVCVNQVASDSQNTPPPATPLPHHTVPFIDSHLHCDYICDQSRSPTFGIFLSKTEMPKTLLGGITTLCDSTAICSSLLSQREDLAQNHKDKIFFTIGLHPHNAKYFDDRIATKMLELMSPCGDPTSFAESAVAGFGEIGLDVDSFKKGGTKLEAQIPVFLQQVQMARGMLPHLPLQLHLRGHKGAVGDLIEYLPFEDLAAAPAVHFHCYGDPNVETAKMLARRVPNCVFGFTGLICGFPVSTSQITTYSSKNDNDNDDDENTTTTSTTTTSNSYRYPCIKRFEELLRWLPLEKFVLESDSPYMVPAPVRTSTSPRNNEDEDNNEEEDDTSGGGYKNAAGKGIKFQKNKGPPIVNHSGHLPFIAAAIADVKGINIDIVLEHAYENTLRVYPTLQRVWKKRGNVGKNANGGGAAVVVAASSSAKAQQEQVSSTTSEKKSAGDEEAKADSKFPDLMSLK